MDTPSTHVAVGRNFALVVGVNYLSENAEDAKRRTGLKPLTRAENDARDFATLLRQKYGYDSPVEAGEGDWVELLTGTPQPAAATVGTNEKRTEAERKPTKTVIEDRLTAWFCNPDNVGKDDSVLFFFSGHAVRADGKLYLLPANVETQEQQGEHVPKPSSMIDLKAVVELLQANCNARHILLILDCCHSGGVFALEGIGSGPHDVHRGGARARSFQAITASRDSEEASDGTADDRNSPFSRALLRAMEAIPAEMPADAQGQRSFTTNELFVGMKLYFDGSFADDQSPQCRWLKGSDDGEFQFVTDPRASFQDVSEDAKRVLLAMVPSTFGNWWADEMPWFMPSLRLEILKDRPDTRSARLEAIDKQSLYSAAQSTLKRLTKELDPRLVEARLPDPAALPTESAAIRTKRRQIDQLRRMLDMDHARDRAQQLKVLIDEMEKATEIEQPEATDIHFLAVLRHLVNDDEVKVEKEYERALELYAKASKTIARLKGLEALCRSDLGVFRLAVQFNYDQAFAEFQRAQESLGVGTPAAFRVFCLIQQSTVRRRQGFVGAADALMAEAHQVIKNVDPEAKHPLSAAAWKQSAWADMELWRFKQAQGNFERAQAILEEPANLERDECSIDRFHVRHGLAMIARFSGRDSDAIEAYGDLVAQIPGTIRALERKTDVPNIAELRALLYERLMNSEDRLGDCYLFGRRPDYEAAAYHYRRAIQFVDEIPEAKRAAALADLLYRQVAALVMQVRRQDQATKGRAFSKEETAARTYSLRLAHRQLIAAKAALGAQTPQLKTDLAKILISGALQCINKPLEASRAEPPSPPNVDELIVMINKLCIGPPAQVARDAVCINKPIEATRDAPTSARNDDYLRDIDVLRASKRRFDRDELERLMFVYRVLMEDEVDTFVALELADRLHSACRSTLRVAGSDPGVLRYLRPYYDAIFATKLKHQPVGSKELIEIAWEATTGDLNPVAHPSDPKLVLFFSGGRCHLLLDALGDGSGRFCVDAEEVDSPLALSRKHDELARPCPDALRQALHRLSLSKDQRLWLIFHDPVHGISELPTGIASTDRLRSPADYFPFQVRQAMSDPMANLELLRPPATPSDRDLPETGSTVTRLNPWP
jgi:tetratricopeptide (TPR) repeat protein